MLLSVLYSESFRRNSCEEEATPAAGLLPLNQSMPLGCTISSRDYRSSQPLVCTDELYAGFMDFGCRVNIAGHVEALF